MVTVMVSSPRQNEECGICCIHTMSKQEGEVTTITVNLASVEKTAITKGERWSNYIRGVIAVFHGEYLVIARTPDSALSLHHFNLDTLIQYY